MRKQAKKEWPSLKRMTLLMRKHITDPVSKHKVLTSILSISAPVYSEAVMNTMVWSDTQKSEEPPVGFSECIGWGPALISLHDPSM